MDPKMQATYDKVMGTPTPPPTAVNPVVTTSPMMPQAPIAPATGPVIPADMATQQAVPASSATAAYTPDNLSFQAAIQAPATGLPLNNNNQHQAAPGHGTSAGLKILYVFAAIVFFIIYTFVWMKIFEIPLPF
jgi:hypothetical protein